MNWFSSIIISLSALVSSAFGVHPQIALNSAFSIASSSIPVSIPVSTSGQELKAVGTEMVQPAIRDSSSVTSSIPDQSRLSPLSSSSTLVNRTALISDAPIQFPDTITPQVQDNTHPAQKPCPVGYICTPQSFVPRPGTIDTQQTIRSESPQQSLPPLAINSQIIPGPESLMVGQMGTWTIDATSSIPSNEGLLYSVEWGDQSSAPDQSSNSFSHSYISSGLYTLSFKVRDTISGFSAQSTYNVMVFNPIQSNTQIATTTLPECPNGSACSTASSTGN